MERLKKIGLMPHARLVDPDSVGYASRVAQRVASGHFAEAEKILQDANDQARERLLYGFSISERATESAAEWAKQRPQSAFAHVALGACMIAKGWAIRGSGWAEDVDKGSWGAILGHFSSAEVPLHKACQLDDTLSEPYAWLIHVGMCGEMSRGELAKYFEEGTRRNPEHFAVFMKYGYASAEKWGGSHKEMLQFARDASERFPSGHVLHYLVANAYCELALAINTEKGQKALLPKLTKPSHAAEVETALLRYAGATLSNLEDKLDQLKSPFTDQHLNQFALALYLTGANQAAKVVFKHLRGDIQTFPWVWVTSGLRERLHPALFFDRACRELGVQ